MAATTFANAQTVRAGGSARTSRIVDTYESLRPDESSAQKANVSGSESASSNHQPEGCIIGTILDQAGAVNVGADVRLTFGGQSSTRKMRSGNNGQFLFINVVPGPFHLTVSAAGFAVREFTSVLRPGETYIVPAISLMVAPALTEVQVRETPLTSVQVADLQIQEQQKQRVFGIFPNFYVSYDADAVSLNPKQKFRLAWKATADPFTVLGVASIAAVEQATNTFDGYGQGMQGYFKRLGATYANVLTATYIGSAIAPSVLKQDPRYFYKGTGNTGSRLLYALASPIICKGNNRSWQPNYSAVAGAFASAGISYFYYPDNNRGASLIVRNSMIRLGEISFEGVLQEFVIRRLTPRLRKRASDRR